MSDASRDDEADANLVADCAMALRRWRDQTGKQPPTKVLREAVWFFWQQPRLERPLIGGKYPRSAPWSEAAAAQVHSGSPPPGGLVIEHIEPMNRLLRRLIDEPVSVDEVLTTLKGGLKVVVVTKRESDLLSDEGTPEERYAGAGLDVGSFVDLDEWERRAGVTVPKE